jgi:macrolide-specific efflux system membrane fusion protein
MRLPSPLLSTRRLKVAAAVAIVLVLAAAGTLIAACGGSSQAAAASGSTPKSTSSSVPIQVMATVTRGNLVDTIAASVKLTMANGAATGVAQVTGQSAAQVASGQSVALSFINPSSFHLPTGGGQSGSSGTGSSSGSSAAPSTGNGQTFPPSGGQGFFGQGNGSGAASAFRGKTAQGTVTSVAHNSNGSVTATIKIAKLPAGVTAKYVGIARINAGVLATNVLIVPTAAIKGSGSNATVEVLTNGTTSTRKVVVGKQTQAESEIVSGLAVGDNLIYMRTFQRGRGFRGGFGGGFGQGTFHQSGGQSTSGASGASGT